MTEALTSLWHLTESISQAYFELANFINNKVKSKLLSCVRLFETPWTIRSMEFSRPEYWSGYPGELPNPGIEPRSPALQACSLPTELPGKPKNTGVGSLSLLQWIFLIQESNWGLLHCRRILYQLSYQGSPLFFFKLIFIGVYSCLQCCVSFCYRAVNQLYKYINPLIFGFPSHLGHRRTLSRFP